MMKIMDAQFYHVNAKNLTRNSMVKNLNLFTGKVDIIADPTDSKQAIEFERYKLGKDAGRVIKPRTQAAPPAPKDRTQTSLF
jgi:hypothetical protein